MQKCNDIVEHIIFKVCNHCLFAVYSSQNVFYTLFQIKHCEIFTFKTRLTVQRLEFANFHLQCVHKKKVYFLRVFTTVFLGGFHLRQFVSMVIRGRLY